MLELLQKVMNLIQRAINMIVIEHTFFAALLLNLKRQSCDASITDTAATDGKYLYYCPDFIATLNIMEIIFVMAHEGLHCALGHIWRRRGRPMKKWNRACDYVVNGILVKYGFKARPKDTLYDPRFDGMSAEQVFSLLDDEGEEQGWGQGDCNLPGQPDPNTGAVSTPAEQEQLSKDWTMIASAAAQMGQACGKLPSEVAKGFIKDIEAQEDWTVRARAWMSEITRADYNYGRPNKRYSQYDIVVPTLYSQEVGHLVIVEDMSGSCGMKQQEAFNAETVYLHGQIRPALTTVIYCDTKIQRIDEFLAMDELEFHPMHGGGTDFRPPFKHIEEHEVQPKALIYFTDCYGVFPDEEPDYPVLFVSVVPNSKVPFGDVIELTL